MLELFLAKCNENIKKEKQIVNLLQNFALHFTVKKFTTSFALVWKSVIENTYETL